MTLVALGDSAIVLTLGNMVDDATLERVRAVSEAIERRRPPGVVDVVVAFATITVHYDLPASEGFAALAGALEAIASAADLALVTLPPSRLVEIPVCYGGDFGPDLGEVAARAQLSPDQAIALHHDTEYRVHALGFAPGFAYLGGLAEKLHTPRRGTPRARIVPGTVGIGGTQTGVYPLVTPGGWNLIGRTPVAMFDPRRPSPALLHAGDRVRFRPIAAAQFSQLETEVLAARVSGGDVASHGDGEFGHSARARFSVSVDRAGMWTTVQDLGRSGHRADGVPLSGAADPVALRVANLLVGNPEEAAALECTLVGPDLTFAADTMVALGGAEFEGLPRWHPVRIQKGTTLKLGAARHGCRGYLAVAGGIEVAPVLGSRSTYVRAALGGLDGRALRPGDRLRAQAWTHPSPEHWHIDERILPAYSEAPTVRVVRGAQAGDFGREFFDQLYRISPQSDRMGVRLNGRPLQRAAMGELLSAAVVPGTIQVPPDGQPIALLADAQTLGGYPQIAHVITVDLPLVAQLRPGASIRFREVTLGQAHDAWLAREHVLAMLREGLAQKYGYPL